jgi:hypothetical protein
MNIVAKRERPRVIQGVLLKCVDGQWKDGDGLTPASEMLVIGITRVLQCWKDKDLLDVIVEQPNEPLPDVDGLNAQIPKQEWGLDLNGNPRPPWSLNWVVYLLDPATASTYTFINSTVGARIAVERLEDKVRWMRTLRGANVAPIVKLDARPMKTKVPGVLKQRPEFTVLEWRDLGDGPTPVMLEHKGGGDAALQIEHQPAAPEKPAIAQGKIGPDVIKRPGKPAPKDGVGKKVKPPSVAEEIDDGLPGDLAPPENPLQAG